MAKPEKQEQQCPACGLAVATGTVRCPRCNQLMIEQLQCSGNCRSCAAKCPSKEG